MSPKLASIIDIDSVDAFADCHRDPSHGPAYGRVIVAPGDVQKLCCGCCEELTGSGYPSNPPRVGYPNNCFDCERDACRVHGAAD